MFLFIAVKDSSEDYCRGCRVASYGNDFHLANWVSRDDLVTVWGQHLQKNMNLDCNETGYEFHVFKNGVQVWEPSGVTWDGAQRYGRHADESFYTYMEQLDAQESQDREEVTAIFADATAVANRLQGEQMTEANHQAAIAARDAADKAKAERFAQLQKLKAEFGEPPPP